MPKFRIRINVTHEVDLEAPSSEEALREAKTLSLPDWFEADYGMYIVEEADDE